MTEEINDYRWAAFQDGKPIFLMRFEDRKLFGFLKTAWIPKGVTAIDEHTEKLCRKEFLKRLKKKNYALCASSSWKPVSSKKLSKDFTIWLDLTAGKETLWKNLDKQFRYDVRRAEKEGVRVETTRDAADVEAFYKLCDSISRRKGFGLHGSPALMLHLLNNNTANDVDSRLFVVRENGKICAGAFIIRCGDNVHYLWGAVDRAYSKLRAGEAVQWKVIEWALENHCKQYDLEGIDLKKNPGTYHFKKKLGAKLWLFQQFNYI